MVLKLFEAVLRASPVCVRVLEFAMYPKNRSLISMPTVFCEGFHNCLCYGLSSPSCEMFACTCPRPLPNLLGLLTGETPNKLEGQGKRPRIVITTMVVHL